MSTISPRQPLYSPRQPLNSLSIIIIKILRKFLAIIETLENLYFNFQFLEKSSLFLIAHYGNINILDVYN